MRLHPGHGILIVGDVIPSLLDKQKLKEFDKSQHLYSPKFKTIYFKGIFENDNAYLFKHHQNFRNEKVNLINKWSENGKIHYEINLHTHTDGRYRFSEDMM